VTLVEKASLKMLVLDLDGTILNDHKEIIPENLKAIQELKKKNPNIIICIVTGRPFLPSIFYARKIGADVLATNDGGAIYLKDDDKNYKLEKAFYMTEKKCSAIFNKIREYSVENPDLFWLFTTDKIKYNVIIGNGEDSLKKAYNIFCPDEKTVRHEGVLQVENFDDLKKLDGLSKHIIKIYTYFGKEDIGKKQYHEFNEFLEKEKGKINCVSTPPFLNAIAPWGIDKGNAVRLIIEKFEEMGIRIKRSEVAIVGNDYNDLAMLKLEGCRSYGPSNAREEIKGLENVHILKQSNNEPWIKELIENFKSRETIGINREQKQLNIFSQPEILGVDKWLAKAKANPTIPKNFTPQPSRNPSLNRSPLDIIR